MALVEQVAEEVKALMGNETYAEIARKTGLDSGYVHRIRHGQRNLTLNTVEEIAEAFDRDVSIKFSKRSSKKKSEK
jgi:transcriptional regulator with XRE-family HTH domain